MLPVKGVMLDVEKEGQGGACVRRVPAQGSRTGTVGQSLYVYDFRTLLF